jgi:hypothetical protein
MFEEKVKYLEEIHESQKIIVQKMYEITKKSQPNTKNILEKRIKKAIKMKNVVKMKK